MKSHFNACPVKGPDGTIYISHGAAAKALGVSKRTIGYHLDTWGNLDRVGREAARLNASRRRPITIGNRQWVSVALFADYIGHQRETVRNWVRKGDMDRIIGALMKADAQQRRAA